MAEAGGSRADELRRAARGAGIGAAAAVASRLIFFIQQLILARLLAADAFGQYAFAVLVVGLPALLVNLRGAEAVVQSDEDEDAVRRLSDTAFTAQLALSLLMIVVVIAGRGLIADISGKAYLATLLLPLAVLILSAVGGPSSNSGPLLLPAATLERRLDFARARLPELANSLVNLLVALGLALGGAGVWSLIGGLIAGSAAQVLLIWRLARFRPRLGVDREMLRRLWAFGWPLYLSALLSWGYLNADYYFVGSFLGERELGFYYMAFNISQAVLQARFILGRLAFPAFARARSEPTLLRRLYVDVTRYTMALAAGLCALGIALARPAVLILLGPEWLPAAPALQILFLSTLLRTGLGFNGDLLTSLGQTGAVLLCTAAALAALLLAGPPLMLRWGLTGMAWAVVLSSLVSAALSSGIIGRRLSLRYVRELGPALLCGAAVVAAGWPFAGEIVNLWGLLAGGLGLGLLYAGLYLGLCDRALARRLLRRPSGA